MSLSGSYDPNVSRNGSSNPTAVLHSPRTATIRAQIDDTVGIMRNNIARVADRGERLDALEERVEDLAVSAQGFRKRANHVRKNMWWKDMKMRIIITVTILVIVGLTIFSIVQATYKPK